MKDKPTRNVKPFEYFKGLTTPLETTSEEREIEAWVEKDVLAEFDKSIYIELRDAKDMKEINFLCDKPQNCESHKQHGECCSCVRENFDSPNAYTHWKQTITNLLEQEVKHFVRKYKK